MPALINTVWS